VANARLATLHELQTIYSLEDAHNLAEIVMVSAENERRAHKANADDN